MKISLEWLSDFIAIPADVSAADLAHELTLKTVEVEDAVEASSGLRHVITARVIATDLHSARGSLVKCDIGKDQPITVVTGSTELKPGAAVVIALPGARVGTRQIRELKVDGIASDGMICTATDLGLQRLFPRDENLTRLKSEPGTDLSKAIGFDDVVLEIDNKSLTNRPDLWGHYGIARELATIYGLKMRPLNAVKRPSKVDTLIGEIDPEVCLRFSAVEFSLAGPAGEAPLWLRSRLARIGESSINLCVDLSNYVMFTVGQPNHVYDADRIGGALSVRRLAKPVKIDLLTGARHELPTGTAVIEDSAGPVGVAGVIGGSGSSVTDEGRRFVLEVATFRPQPVRWASQRLGIRTEASARYEKALDTPRVDGAIDLFLGLLPQAAPGATVTASQDLEIEPTQPSQIDVDLGYLSTRIGQDLDPKQTVRTLTSLGFAVTKTRTRLHVTAPSWRSTGDISQPHDIVEEVARIHGYDNIPTAPLAVALNPARQLNKRPLYRTVREALASRGSMNEVVTYPWVADNLLAATGIAKEQTVRFEGAPAPDLDSLRPSLVPNLLQATATNLRYRPAVQLFEVGNVFAPEAPAPRQRLMLAATIAGADGPTLFRQAKGVLEMLRKHCHIVDLEFGTGDRPMWADPRAHIALVAAGAPAGTLGLLTTRCRRALGVEDAQVACFEVDLSVISAHTSRDNRFKPVPELPEATFDLSIVIADKVAWSSIEAIALASNDLIHRVEYVGEFRGGWVPADHRSLTLRLTLRPLDTTLTADDMAAARTYALSALEKEVGARLRE